MSAEVYFHIQDICKILNINYEYKLNSDDIENIKYDKKQSSNRYRFILLKNIGKPIICDDISKDDILSII
jgi:3-dehydroquinate synthetase